MFLREMAFKQSRLGIRCMYTYYILYIHVCKQMGQHLLTYISRMEYPTLFSWTSPLPFWVNIFNDQDLCAFVKTVSFTNIFPASQGNLKKQNNTHTHTHTHTHFDPPWVQRIDGVVSMVIENYFASCIFWFILFVIVVMFTQIG